MSPLEEWFSSNQSAIIAGHSMKLRRHPHIDVPLEIQRGQASAYWLAADDNSPWILKKFLPARQPQFTYLSMIGSRIPQEAAFRCGWQRQVLTPQDLTQSWNGFWSEALGVWINGTVLMPQLTGESWGNLLFKLAEGEIGLSANARFTIARKLVNMVLSLERANISHRDLSAGNILVDLSTGDLHLIDWDSLFHPVLQFQSNTTVGMPGYIPPWAMNDAQLSWCPRADRFALAICVAEILTVAPGTMLHGDGSLFEQQSLGRDRSKLVAVTSALQAVLPKAVDLFQITWGATTFDECPSPAAWLRIFSSSTPIISIGHTPAKLLKQLNRRRTAISGLILIAAGIAIFIVPQNWPAIISSLPSLLGAVQNFLRSTTELSFWDMNGFLYIVGFLLVPRITIIGIISTYVIKDLEWSSVSASITMWWSYLASWEKIILTFLYGLFPRLLLGGIGYFYLLAENHTLMLVACIIGLIIDILVKVFRSVLKKISANLFFSRPRWIRVIMLLIVVVPLLLIVHARFPGLSQSVAERVRQITAPTEQPQPSASENIPNPTVVPPTATPTPEPLLGVVTVNELGLYVRAGPGTQFAVIGGLRNEDIVTLQGRNLAGDWLMISYKDGPGWVYATHISTDVVIDELPLMYPLN